MKIVNKKARYDYFIEDKFEAGIVLYGHEVKAIKAGQVDLFGSHVRIVGAEAYLIGARIYTYKYARPDGYDEKRTRKLLLHKKQIISLKTKLESSNLTLIPLSLYTRDNLVKLEVGLGKGKKKYQKKEEIKRRDIQKDIEREIKF